MWNMRPDPPYIPAKIGEDSLKPKRVMAKNHRILNEKIRIIIIIIIIIRILMKLYKNKRTFPYMGMS